MQWLLAAVFASAVTLAPLAACGPAKGKCSTSTCSGCCDDKGECQPGNTFAACGTSGAACMLCSTGTSCELGLCASTSGQGGGGGSTGGGSGTTGGGGGATGGGGGTTGGGGGTTGGGGGTTGGGGGTTGGGGGTTGGGGGTTGGGGGTTGGGGGATGGGGGGMPSTTPLASGVAITISGAIDSSTYYSIDVPVTSTSLSIVTTGGTGDVDLYLRYGQLPTFTDADEFSENTGNDETITVTPPDAGTWYLEAYGFEDYANVSLTATW